MTHVTFLGAAKPLCKIFTDEAVTPYPLTKNFTSFIEEADSIAQLYNAIVKHADKKHCLHKGNFNEPLQDESRRGKADKFQKSDLFVLDVDGFELEGVQIPATIPKSMLEMLSESIMMKLPKEFHNVSYISQASASLGMKGNKVSLHFFFLLDAEADPREQKEVLTLLNLNEPFKDGLELTATGTSLKYPIDICMAQNTRIVYIANPMFNGIDDPVETRTILKEKTHERLNIRNLLASTTPAAIKEQVKAIIKSLRSNTGLSRHAAQVKQHFDLEGERIELVLNPDPCRIEFAYENGDFVYFNLNGGDSNAYYTKISDPYIVYNFKGDPAFKMVDVDPEFFSWFLEEYKDRIEQASEYTPFVFSDMISAKYYRGLYDPDTSELIEINACNQGDLANYMLYKNAVPPDPLPVWRYQFDPHSFVGIDPSNEFVNRFQPTPYLRITEQLDADVGYFTGADVLKVHCPWIYRNIAHALNYSDPEILHFLNWLAFIIKNRAKSKMAWILSGTQGTGKGNIFNKIVAPILGDHAYMGTTRQLEDNFNDWIRYNLFLAVDEFNISDSQNANMMENFIKNMITEPKITPRAMRKDPEQVINHSNIVIFSNQYDSMNIPENDRRFTVAPRQEEPIIARYPNIHEVVEKHIPAELTTFMKFINAYNVEVLEASRPLINQAKMELQSVTESTPSEFARAIRTGDLDYFVRNIMEIETTGSFDDMILNSAKSIVKSLIQHSESGDMDGIHLNDVAILYAAASGDGRIQKPAKCSSMMQHNGLEKPKEFRLFGKKRSGWRTTWKLKSFTKQELINEYFTAVDNAYVGAPKVTSIQEANE